MEWRDARRRRTRIVPAASAEIKAGGKQCARKIPRCLRFEPKTVSDEARVNFHWPSGIESIRSS